APRDLAFSAQRDLASWRHQLQDRLSTLVGDMPQRVDPAPRWGDPVAHEGFSERRLVFSSEPGVDVPCTLLVPHGGEGPFPLMICLQGHSSGMHISLGRAQHPGDERALSGDRDYALQAVARGFAALAVEQRCLGERLDRRPEVAHHFDHTCVHASMVSLLLGRTMIGERVWDISRAIDVVSGLDAVATTRIACMGNSGGGTVTYYAACLEPRIAAVMPSCSVCTYRSSIGSIDHCPDNYVPGALRHFDMGDLAGLIAPRPLVVVAGRDDPIFPLSGVEEAMETIRRIYSAHGAPGGCELVVGEGGHRFYAQAWDTFLSITG
ncbi:MAG TPA: alpha/beta hydrolase family protein, partial [Candidatus Dormibacteraeota bacterium]|nr:alpha/beta hydrolase family protein [Candidatus Dormibacteraeota bacterium]